VYPISDVYLIFGGRLVGLVSARRVLLGSMEILKLARFSPFDCVSLSFYQ
jgi:hypothetical protein